MLVCLLLWIAPLPLLWLVYGQENTLLDIGLFFGRAAVVTFGGAYAALAYIAQEAVSTYGWLQPGEMLDGLGLAETTPGPLIQVVQFVGFLASFREAGGMNPYLAGVLGAVLVTWVTFTPSFLWIFLGAPWIERLRGNAVLAGALAAITAAVVGVIANLSIWFALHVLFRDVQPAQVLAIPAPVLASFDGGAALLTVGAAVLMLALRRGFVLSMGFLALVGMLVGLL